MKGRKWLGLLVIGAVLALSLAIVFAGNDPAAIVRIISSLHPGWVLAAVGCWFGFLFFDALGYCCYYRSHGHAISLWHLATKQTVLQMAAPVLSLPTQVLLPGMVSGSHLLMAISLPSDMHPPIMSFSLSAQRKPV